MKIESKDTDIESLLNSNYFHIPRFQRPYSWDDDNINDFWSDVITNDLEDYFIGSMVVFKKSKQQFGVVDGQQRLTTITILLCVIRDEFRDLNCDDQAEGIQRLIERKDLDNRNEYVLKTETSFPYFQEYIQKDLSEPDFEVEVKSEESNLKNAHDRFKQYVKEALDLIDSDSGISKKNKKKEKVNKLTEIRDSVLSLNLIFIILDNEDV